MPKEKMDSMKPFFRNGFGITGPIYRRNDHGKGLPKWNKRIKDAQWCCQGCESKYKVILCQPNQEVLINWMKYYEC